MYAASLFKHAALTTQRHHKCEGLFHRCVTPKKMSEYDEAEENPRKVRRRGTRLASSWRVLRLNVLTPQYLRIIVPEWLLKTLVLHDMEVSRL